MSANKLDFLRGLQEELGGAIPFDRWMREALYHETFGYYTATIRGIGRRGDFTTWPVVHRSLAEGIARWVKAQRPRGAWHLIEVGAGTGELAEAVLRALGWWRRPRLHIVEVSGPLRDHQRQRLGRRAIWHSDLAAALEACDGAAVIYSNELIDAFPCRVFQKQDTIWRELALRIEDGRVGETWRETALPASDVFRHDWPEGQRVEVQDSFRRWIDGWLPAWKTGAFLAVDYGDVTERIYHRRPRGTLRAYSHHQRLEPPEAYGGFGLRDLTVDVNFTDVAAWLGEGAVFGALSGFLGRQGITPGDSLREAGEAFQCLTVAR